MLFLVLWSCSDTAGGGTEGGNVDMVAVVESDAATAANARIFLFPEGYNPNDTSELKVRDTIADVSGKFTFSALDTGDYTLRISSADGKEGLLTTVSVKANDDEEKTYTISPVGAVTLLLDKGIDTVGKFCYVPHTDINLPLSAAVADESGRYLKLTYNALPPGELDTLRIWNTSSQSAEEVVAEDVVVTSGEEQTVGEAFHWIPVQKNGMLLSPTSLVYTASLLGDTLWFATGKGLYMYPTMAKVWSDKTSNVASTYYEVVRSPYDNVLIGTATGAFAQVDASWLKDTVKYKAVGSNPVFGIWVEKSGRVWFALGSNGVVTVKGDDSETITQIELANKEVVDIIQGSSGTILFLCRTGEVLTEDGSAYGILPLHDLWVKKIIHGTGDALYLLANERVYTATESQLLAGNVTAIDLGDQIEDIAFDSASETLFATTDDSKRLLKYKDGVQSAVSFADELSGDDCRLIVQDGEGFLYTNEDLASFTYMY